MSIERNKSLVQRHLNLSWNDGNIDALDEVWAADAVVHLWDSRPIRDRRGSPAHGGDRDRLGEILQRALAGGREGVVSPAAGQEPDQVGHQVTG